MANICHRNIFLHFKQGISDKDYNIFIDERPDGVYQVYSKYGKHGKANTHFPITETSNYGLAFQSFDMVKYEKIRKGYVVIAEDVNLWAEKKKALVAKTLSLLSQKKISGAEYDKIIAMLDTSDDETRTLAEKIITQNSMKSL